MSLFTLARLEIIMNRLLVKKKKKRHSNPTFSIFHKTFILAEVTLLFHINCIKKKFVLKYSICLTIWVLSAIILDEG